MLFQVAERSLRFCRLFETKNVNGKIRFFRVRPGRILTIARIVKGRRQAKFNVLFSSSLHSRVHQCPLRMLRASVVRACPSRIFSSAKIVKAEKKTGACSQFSEACPIFCKDKRFIRFPDASSGKNRNFGKKLRNLCQGTIDQPRITGAESVIRVISPVICFLFFRAEYPIFAKTRRGKFESRRSKNRDVRKNPLRDENKQLNLIGMKTNLNYDMFVPTRTLFGAGTLNELHAQPMPGRKALLVISNGRSTRANSYLSRTEEQLRMAGVETVLFDRVEANPLKSTVMAGGAMARENGCDMIVALGGGSGSGLGTGGMATKLKAAQIVTEVGCQMVIANGSKPALLYDIVGGKPVGTRFLAKEK